MRGRYAKVLRDCAIVCQEAQSPFYANSLGAGSVVRVVHPDEAKALVNPLGIPYEVAVEYLSLAGGERLGWLAKGTPLGDRVGQRALTRESIASSAALSALDQLRYHMGMEHADAFTYLAVQGYRLVPELQRVIRELGGKPRDHEDDETVIRRAMRLILNREVTMAEVEQAREQAGEKRAKKSATKANGKANGKAKKSAKGGEREVTRAVAKEPARDGGRSASRSAGEALVPLLKKAKSIDVLKLAQSMVDGKELSAGQLAKLRDGVNAAAASAREADNGSLASELSAANRLVRRLQRQAAE